MCLGVNQDCNRVTRPYPCDILVGLNYDFDSTRYESGQIYYQHLNSDEFILITNLVLEFEPINVFMIIYDNIFLDEYKSPTSRAAFQIFLATDSKKSYVLLKYTLCPTYISLEASSGLNYINESSFQESIILHGQQCTGSNIDQEGVWVYEVTGKY